MRLSDKRRVTFGCTLPPEMLERIDHERGMAPRTRYVEYLIRKALNGKCVSCPKTEGSPDNEKV